MRLGPEDLARIPERPWKGTGKWWVLLVVAVVWAIIVLPVLWAFGVI